MEAYWLARRAHRTGGDAAVSLHSVAGARVFEKGKVAEGLLWVNDTARAAGVRMGRGRPERELPDARAGERACSSTGRRSRWQASVLE
jgi:hypothetical protein